MNKLVHLAVYALSLAIAYVLCRTVFGVVLPEGFSTPLTPTGVTKYLVAFILGLFITLGMVVMAARAINWIYSPKQVADAA